MDFGGGAGEAGSDSNRSSFLNVYGTVFGFAALINKQNF